MNRLIALVVLIIVLFHDFSMCSAEFKMLKTDKYNSSTKLELIDSNGKSAVLCLYSFSLYPKFQKLTRIDHIQLH